MSALGSLVVKLALEYSQYTQGLDKADQKALSFAKNVQDSMDGANKATVNFLGGLVTGAVAAVASYETVANAVEKIRHAIDSMDKINDLSSRIGIATGTLQELAYAGKFADASLEAVGTGTKKLSQAMLEAATGGKEQIALFKAIGVEVKNTDGTLRGVSEVFGDVSDVFAGLEDGATKTALAVKLFGKSGADLIPLLNGGRDEMEKMREEAHKFGLVLSEEAISAAAQFNDNIDKLGKIQEGTWNAISKGVLPVMLEYSKAAVAAASDTNSVNQEAQRLANDGSLTSWAKDVIDALTYVADAAEGVWRVLKIVGQSVGAVIASASQGVTAYQDALAALKRGDFAGIGEAFVSGSRQIKSTFDQLGTSIDKALSDDLFGAKIRARVGDIKAFGAATTDADRELNRFASGAKLASDAAKKMSEARIASALAQSKEKSAAQDVDKANNDFIETIAKMNVELDAQLAKTDKLTPAEKLLAELKANTTKKVKELTEAQRQARIVDAEALVVKEHEADIEKRRQQATSESVKARQQDIDSLGKAAASAEEQARAEREQLAVYGLSKAAILDRNAARLEEQATLVEGQAVKRLDRDLDQQAYDLAIRQAQAIRDRADAMRGLAHAEREQDAEKAAADQGKASYEEWKRWNDQIGQSLADALMQGGKSARDYLKGIFRNLVLRPIIQSAFAPLTGALAAFASGSASAGGNGSAVVNGINGASAIGNLYSAATGYSSGLSALASYLGAGTTAGASAASLGYANLVGAAGGDSLGALIAANGSWSGVAAGSSLGAAAAGEGVAAGSGAAAAAGAGGASASSLVATLGPYAVIALALLAIFGDFSKFSLGTVAEGKLIGDKLKAFQFGDAGLQFGNNPEKARGGQLQSAVDLYGGSLASTASYFGGSANGLGLSIATDLDREGKIAAIVRLLSESGSLIGGTQTGSGAFTGTPTTAAEKIGADKVGEWFTQNLPLIIVQGLQQSTLPKRFEEFFGSVAADALTPETAQALLDTATNVQKLTTAFKPLGGVFGQFETLAVDAFKKVADAAGGFDALGTAVAAYYQGFYTESERLADSTAAVSKSLADVGVAMPDLSHGADAARASFRALVDAQDLSTDAGRTAFAALINVSGAFSQVADATDAIAKQIKSTNFDLELELLQALGKDSEALTLQRQKELDALREIEAATGVAAGTFTDLKEQIYAAVDAAKAAAQQQQIMSKLDGVIADFLSGSELATYRAGRIKDTLAKGGIDSSIEGIIGATKDQIRDLWNAVGPEGKDAILEAYGSWKALEQALADDQIAALIDGIASSADDLMSAYNEINPAADNLVDSWRKNKSAMDELKSALDEIAGTKAKSAIDTLRDTIAARDALASAVDANNEQILQLKAGQGGQKAVDALKAREAELWNEFARTGSSQTAQALTRITLQRIQAEGKVQEEAQQKLNDAAYKANLDAFNLQKAQYDAQKQAAQDQIDAAKRIQDLAKGVPQFLGSLRAGNLSNLSYTGRLDQQKALFEDSLKTGVDPQSQLTAYLQQAQQLYGGATAQYSAIFTQALAQYQSSIEEQAAKAPDTIALAQAQLDSIDALAPKLESAIVDTSDAQIAALGSLNELFDGRISTLNDSVESQTKLLQDQLKKLTDTVTNQEAQITQNGEAYKQIIEGQRAILGELRSANSNARLDTVLNP